MPKKSPLYEVERAAGAQFNIYHDWELPEVFRDALGEHQIVRQAAGLIDCSDRGRIELTGPERVNFLNNMVTNDIKTLPPGAGVYAALLTVHGKLLSDFIVYAYEDRLVLDVPGITTEKVFTTLNRFLISEKAEIRNVSDQFATLSVQGPSSRAWLNRWASFPEMKPLDITTVAVDGTPATVARVSYTGEEGYDITVPRERVTALWSCLLEIGADLDAQPVGMTALNTLRIEAGIPWYGVDMDESHIVLEAALDKAISTTKGCYIGQETVARIIFRGHVNKKLTGLFLRGQTVPPPKSRVLHDGKPIGVITSAIASPTLQRIIALGYMHRDFLQPGTPVTVEVGTTAEPAEVAALPFYDRELIAKTVTE